MVFLVFVLVGVLLFRFGNLFFSLVLILVFRFGFGLVISVWFYWKVVFSLWLMCYSVLL